MVLQYIYRVWWWLCLSLSYSDAFNCSDTPCKNVQHTTSTRYLKTFLPLCHTNPVMYTFKQFVGQSGDKAIPRDKLQNFLTCYQLSCSTLGQKKFRLCQKLCTHTHTKSTEVRKKTLRWRKMHLGLHGSNRDQKSHPKNHSNETKCTLCTLHLCSYPKRSDEKKQQNKQTWEATMPLQ